MGLASDPFDGMVGADLEMAAGYAEVKTGVAYG